MRKIFSLFLILLFSSCKAWAFDISTAVKQDFRRWSVNDAIDLSVNVSYLFIPQIVELEEQGVGFFGKCKVFTEPLTPSNLGLTYEKYGVVDSIKAQYLQNLYGSYGDVAYVVDEEKVIEYANCLARYGMIIAQAQLNLYGSLKQYGKVLKGRIKGKIELEKLKNIVKKVLLDAMNGKYSPQIRQWASKNISGPCKFAGSPGVIMCGAYLLKLQPPQELSLQGFQLFGTNFMGIGGSIRISKTAGSEMTAFEYVPVMNQYQ
jgi:uncharacterized protein YjhX (UPF0386 family)